MPVMRKHDDALWLRHLRKDGVDVGLAPISFSVDGTRVDFVPMQVGRDGRPTYGLRAEGVGQNFWKAIPKGATFVLERLDGLVPALSAVAPAEPSPRHPRPPESGDRAGEEFVWGIDWSGAYNAGKKVWRAKVDPKRKRVVEVSRPYESDGPAAVGAKLVAWMNTLTSASIAIDFPFGLPMTAQTHASGRVSSDPRERGALLVERFSTVNALKVAAHAHKLCALRRATDSMARAPWAPLFDQLVAQTYWGHQLLSAVPKTVAILPWDRDSKMPVRLVEACPASTLKRLHLSNRGYKRSRVNTAPAAQRARMALFHKFLAAAGWTSAPEVRQAVKDDDHGDAADAIFAAHAAFTAAATNHEEVACSHAHYVFEGVIYA